MAYRGKHGRGKARGDGSMPHRWERKQSEREAAREEARRAAAERLGRGPEVEAAPEVSRAAEPWSDEETAPFAAVAEDDDGDGDGAAPVGRALEALAVALLLGGLLTAHEIKARAEEMPVGLMQKVAVIAATPGAFINSALRIDDGWEKAREWARSFMDAPAGSGGAQVPSAAPSVPSTTSPSEVTSQPLVPYPADGRGRRPTNSAPLDVYIVGDSLSLDVGAAFVNASVRMGCIESKRFYRSATGLSRPDVFDWPAELRREMASTHHEAVIAMFGGNDGQSVEYDGKVLNLYTPEWEALYAERVGTAMDILTAGGQRLYWIGLPIPRSEKQAKKYEMMNRIYIAEAKKRPAVVYVDSWQLFSGPSGGYAEMLENEHGKLVDMRKDDGIHFTMAGADRMAASVLSILCADWGIPLR